MKKKALIFDLDGTLINTLQTLAYFVNTELKSYDIEPIPTEEFKWLTGNGTRILLERALNFRNQDTTKLEQIMPSYVSNYTKNPTYLTEVYDDIIDLLTELKKRKILCAVFTNKPHDIAQKVVRHFFGDTFTFVLGQKEGVAIKPDPIAVLEYLEQYQLTAQDIVYTGDTPIDMQTGLSAGFTTVGLTWGFRSVKDLEAAGAPHIVNKAQELLAFFE